MAGSAHAELWMQTSCANPDQSAASSEGWTGGSTGTPSRGSTNNTNCTPSSPMYAGLGNGSPAPSGASEYLQYTPPAGSKLVGGTLLAGLSADGYGEGAVATAAMMTPAAQYDATQRLLAVRRGAVSVPERHLQLLRRRHHPARPRRQPVSQRRLPRPDPGEELQPGRKPQRLVAGLGRSPPTCCSPPARSRPRRSSAAACSRPARTAPRTSRSPHRTPAGPGIYKARVTIDGTTVYDATPNTNAGRCAPVGTDPATGALMFSSQQPCPQTQRVVIPISTTRLADGEHEVKVTLQTAARNESTVLVQTITTINRTTVSGELTSDAPAASAGAPEPVYAMVLDPATQALAKGVRRRYSRSALQLSGTLHHSSGIPAPGVAVTLVARNGDQSAPQILARTTSDAAGHWVLQAPKGPSRALTITYGSGANGAVTIAQTVTPALSLRVSALGRGRLRFTGRLSVRPLGSPRPLVVIQARNGTRWQAVGSAVRVKPNGSVHADLQRRAQRHRRKLRLPRASRPPPRCSPARHRRSSERWPADARPASSPATPRSPASSLALSASAAGAASPPITRQAATANAAFLAYAPAPPAVRHWRCASSTPASTRHPTPRPGSSRRPRWTAAPATTSTRSRTARSTPRSPAAPATASSAPGPN